MLAMQLQIGFRDAVRVGHVVVDSRSRQSVSARTVLLSPANRCINRHVRNVDALRHQFPCHALRKSGLGVTCHREGAARRVAFERRACVREDDRSSCAVGVRLVFAHEPSCLLTHQKRAERRVSKCLENHAGVGFGDALTKNARNPAVDVVHEKRRRPQVSNNMLEQLLNGRWFACIAGYRRTPCVFSRLCRTGLSGFRAAMAMRMPLSANSLAQLELMPGPPPTMSATSCAGGGVSRLSD